MSKEGVQRKEGVKGEEIKEERTRRDQERTRAKEERIKRRAEMRNVAGIKSKGVQNQR